MAKAYRIKQDVSFPRVIARTGDGDDAEYTTEGSNYAAGSILHHRTLTPRDAKRAESGELDHLLEPLSDEEADAYEGFDGSQEPEVGIFVPEHEAEQHALEAHGHHIVPKEQVLEAMSAGEEHSARYQQAVKEAGMDHRPNQEALAQPRPRVPDEVLYGGQTPSGAQHNAGPDPEPDSDEGEGSEEPTRPRPDFGSVKSPDSSEGQE